MLTLKQTGIAFGNPDHVFGFDLISGKTERVIGSIEVATQALPDLNAATHRSLGNLITILELALERARAMEAATRPVE